MNAVIFDMDGVIVDSEPLWQQAEREVFSSLGVQMNEELCQLTQRMTTDEVTKFWFERNPWKGKSMLEVENMVIDRVIDLIGSVDCSIPGVIDTVKALKSRGLKLGLATNSPYRIIPEVLSKMNLTEDFVNISSAEFESNGKPEPDVYLNSLQQLNESAEYCLAIEDSNSGIQAAKKAGITVLAFTNKNRNRITEEVSFKLDSFERFDFSIFK